METAIHLAQIIINHARGNYYEKNKEKVVRANPITYVSKDDPPFLIVYGDQDSIVPLCQSQLLYDALRKSGVDVTSHIVKGAGHGFEEEHEVDKLVPRLFDKYLKSPHQ